MCFAVDRACHGVVGSTMNDGMRVCEVLSNGEWPHAKAMKSKDGHPTSSGKPSAAEGPHRGGRCEPCPFDLRTSWLMSLWRRLCTCEANRVSSIPHGQRAVSSATAASLRLRCVHDLRRRGGCEDTVNVDVPLDSLPVSGAVRCLSFVLWF